MSQRKGLLLSGVNGGWQPTKMLTTNLLEPDRQGLDVSFETFRDYSQVARCDIVFSCVFIHIKYNPGD